LTLSGQTFKPIRHQAARLPQSQMWAQAFHVRLIRKTCDFVHAQ
jgi:hypothetical protein